VFIAVAEQRTFAKAAKQLITVNGVPYSARSVSNVIEKIELWLGEPPFETVARQEKRTTERGEQFLHAARSVVAEYAWMRAAAPDYGLPRLACLPHHTHFVARAEDLLLQKEPAGQEKIVVEYLDPQHRGDRAFHDWAVPRLGRNIYQLIIGPPVDNDAFRSRELYTAQLEAMITDTYPHDAISLTELIGEHRLFVPPTDLRARQLLEERIVEWKIPDPRRESRIAGEAYETAHSVVRIRNEQHRNDRDSRVLVVPSDVALVYKVDWEFGGLNANKFKWVPIYHRDARGRNHRLQYKVNVTTRRRGAPDARKLFDVIDALRDAVAKLPLSGQPMPDDPPVPAQRTP
jgi:DNA-binding transcriptional LysR family regulator